MKKKKKKNNFKISSATNLLSALRVNYSVLISLDDMSTYNCHAAIEVVDTNSRTE